MSNNLDDLLKELRDEYIASLPQKIVTISEHLKQQDWTTLRDDFHKLKGTGKTYGLPVVSEIGEVVEKICLTKTQSAPQAIPLAVDLLLKVYQLYKTTPTPPAPVQFPQELEALRKLL
ncbi:MAG: Hpt domain-containing protein [Bdellovibrionota bacterium]